MDTTTKNMLFKKEKQLKDDYQYANNHSTMYSKENIAAKCAAQSALMDVIEGLGLADEYMIWEGKVDRASVITKGMNKDVIWNMLDTVVDELLVTKNAESVSKILEKAGAGEQELKALELI